MTDDVHQNSDLPRRFWDAEVHYWDDCRSVSGEPSQEWEWWIVEQCLSPLVSIHRNNEYDKKLSATIETIVNRSLS